MTGVRFSLQMTRIHTRQAWLANVRKAEDLGYDAVMTADHLTACAPPLLALAAAAQATSSLRMGTLVLNNDLRHPCVLAREVAAIDLLSDGRVEIGLGAGYAEEEYRRAGLAFDPAPVRIARLGESARLLRRLLDGEVVEHSGEHYVVRGESCEQRPIQSHVPLLIGGAGRRTLTLAAGVADTVGIAGTGRDRRAEHVDRQTAWIRDAAAAANRAPDVQLLLHTVAVSPRRSRAEETLARHLPELSPQEADQSPYALVGSTDEIVEKLLARQSRWGIRHYTVRFDAMTAFAPVLARMAEQAEAPL